MEQGIWKRLLNIHSFVLVKTFSGPYICDTISNARARTYGQVETERTYLHALFA